MKAASDIYAPVSGVVTEINEQLNDQANLLNKDSEGRGESGLVCRGSPIPARLGSSASLSPIPFRGLWKSTGLIGHCVTGWLCKIKLSNPSEFEALLSEKAYKAHCEGESE